MATSGDTSLTITRDDIITEALELLGVLEAGVSPNSDDLTSAARSLNFIIKAWQTDGLQVFTVKRGYLFLERSQHEYELSTTGDHWTYEYKTTTLAADAAAAQAQVEVSDITDMVVGGYFGLELDDGTVVWDTIATLDGGNLLSLSSNLASIASSGNSVSYHTSKADEPMSVVEASLRNESLNDRPLHVMSRQEWSELSNKTYDGSVTQVYFDERVTPPMLFTWPESAQDFDIIVLWIKRVTESFVTANDNPDFPQQWFYPLATNLAVAIGPKFGTPATNKNFAEVKRQAIEWYEKAQNYDSGPEANVQFQPEMGR